MTATKKQRIINCVTQLPYKIQLNESSNIWKLSPLSGNSALFSSLNYLSNSKDYEQVVVGWTGEITREDDLTAQLLEQQKQQQQQQQQQSQEKSQSIDEVVEDSTITASNHDNPTESIPLEADEPFYLTLNQMDDLTNALNSKDEKNYNPIWLLRKDQNRWRQYAEKTIWPTFHYILNPADIESDSKGKGEQENNWWYDYVKFNEAYAMKIGEIYQKGDIIWIHDYYLMLLPQLLRMKFSDDNILIGYFHHAPWPSYEYFRCLPRRKQILDGLVGANKICFQNEQFSRHFVSSCKRLLDSTATKLKDSNGFDQYQLSAYGGDVVVDSLPIGVDKDQLLKDAFTSDIDTKVLAIKDAYQNKKIIIGRDRLDSVRGVVQKLRAFETFLAMYPEWRDQVVLIQVSSPTTNRDSPQTIRLEQQVNDLVNSINSEYGNLNFSPVQHYYMRIPKDVYLSLLRVADCCMITSVRDGMNTTALEYVTIKSNQQATNYDCYGNPLILSEFSGSSTVLKDAIIVNPWDSVAVAKSINMALKMPIDVKENLQAKLSPEVPTIQSWTDLFLESLTSLNDNHVDRKITPALNRPILLQNYKDAQRRLFLFDYDGTLTPIVQDPAAAIPTAKLYNIMEKLAEDPKNQIWIISGRDQQFLNKWWGSKNKNIGLSAEHGCFIKDVNSPDWVNLTEKVDMSWQERVSKCMEEITNKTPGSFIEKKKVALTWHYRRAVPELGEYNAAELKKNLLIFCDDYDLEVMDGKANIEVRPRFVNKGEIVKRLVWHEHGSPQDLLKPVKETIPREQMPDFILCLGDDFTDEDMFRQLNTIEEKWETKFPDGKNKLGHYGVYPVTVGSASKKTVAKAHLTDPGQVVETLALLVGKVSLFQSAGTVELDSRGHVKDSESSKKSQIATEKYTLKRTASSTSVTKAQN
ncbi:trehalose-phosphatase [Monosporozyma unispora]